MFILLIVIVLIIFLVFISEADRAKFDKKKKPSPEAKLPAYDEQEIKLTDYDSLPTSDS
jgi:hypothetical protein